MYWSWTILILEVDLVKILLEFWINFISSFQISNWLISRFFCLVFYFSIFFHFDTPQICPKSIQDLKGQIVRFFFFLSPTIKGNIISNFTKSYDKLSLYHLIMRAIWTLLYFKWPKKNNSSLKKSLFFDNLRGTVRAQTESLSLNNSKDWKIHGSRLAQTQSPHTSHPATLASTESQAQASHAVGSRSKGAKGTDEPWETSSRASRLSNSPRLCPICTLRLIATRYSVDTTLIPASYSRYPYDTSTIPA